MPDPNKLPPGPPRPQGTPSLGGGKGLWRIAIWLILLAVLVPWAARSCGYGSERGRRATYSEFLAQVKDDNVTSVTMKGQEIRVHLKKALPAKSGTPAATQLLTYLPSVPDDQLLPLLEQKGVQIGTEPESQSTGWILLLNALPLVLLFGLGWMFISRMRSQGQQIFNVGKSGARRFQRTDESTTFDDVAGAEGAKTELREIIDFLRDPHRYRRLGGAPPKGVLLVGPPGTGKTLLARASAGEAGAPFFNITGSDFMEMFVGVGASRVRDLFREARRSAPAIIFIDELDSIGRRRGTGLGGGHDEREQTLNQLLSEMDGFEPNEGVVVMAATNRPDILDPALLRPGRFDRRITVDLAGVLARQDILAIHARGKPLGPDVDLAEVARGTPGFSGADLKNLLNEAALLAGRKNKDQIEREDIEEARDKILLGLVREGLALTPEELRVLAYHEAGHAVAAAVMPRADRVHKVTIVPRGRAMGVTQQMPDRERYVYEQEYIMDRLAILMAGRAAERLVLNTATSGAEQDLQEASRLARRMVMSWGMSEKLSNLAFGEREHVFLGEELGERREFSEHTARLIDDEVMSILAEAGRRAAAALVDHREALDRLAELLLKEEVVDGAQVLQIVAQDSGGAAVDSKQQTG